MLTVTDNTHAQVQITVLSSSPVGFASLTTTTDGEVVTLEQAIDIEEGFPALLASTPNAGEQADTFDMQVLGRFTSWVPTTVAQFNNQDITVNSINVIDNDNIDLECHCESVGLCRLRIALRALSDRYDRHGAGDRRPAAKWRSGLLLLRPAGRGRDHQYQPATDSTGIDVAFDDYWPVYQLYSWVAQVSFGDPNFAVGQITVNSPTSLTVPVAVSTSASTGFKNVTSHHVWPSGLATLLIHGLTKRSHAE